MKKIAFLTLAGLMAGISYQALAADGKLDNKTEKFVKTVPIASLFEIKTSELALEKSTNPEIKAFAQQMITDHTKTSGEFKAAVGESNIPQNMLPTGLDDKHQKMYDKLVKEKSGKEFDEEYVDAQEDAHEEAVKLFKDYADDGKDANLKAFAVKTLPTLQKHKEHVEKF